MIKSDGFRQKGDNFPLGLRGAKRIKQWSVDFGGEGSGVTIQYGLFFPDDVSLIVLSGGTNFNPYFAFTPSLDGNRMQAPMVLCDAWPGGTVRFPSGSVRIEAYVFGSWANMGPLDWHFQASSGMGPVARAPTMTDIPVSLGASTNSGFIPIPNRAKSVRVLCRDNAYSTGAWFEYGIDATTRFNSEIITTRDIGISGTGAYYRLGNNSAAARVLTPIFTLDV